MLSHQAHWCACLWHLVASLTDGPDNWVRAYGIEDAGNFYRYTTSFYWAVMTLTTIGYGDVSAQNSTEQVFAAIIMLLGGGVYAYVVGGLRMVAHCFVAPYRLIFGL